MSYFINLNVEEQQVTALQPAVLQTFQASDVWQYEIQVETENSLKSKLFSLP